MFWYRTSTGWLVNLANAQSIVLSRYAGLQRNRKDEWIVTARFAGSSGGDRGYWSADLMVFDEKEDAEEFLEELAAQLVSAQGSGMKEDGK